MTKVLGQVGVSLADQYDVKGSIAGVDRLDVEEVKAVHELGATMFSERLASRVVQTGTGALLQSVNFDMAIGPDDIVPQLPSGVARILALSVFADTAARTTRVQVSMHEPIADRDIPLFVWNTALDSEIEIDVDTVAGNNVFYFRPVAPLPWGDKSIVLGRDQRETVPTIVCRGATSAFGAGNVAITLRLYIAFAESQGLSSYGVPVPSW